MPSLSGGDETADISVDHFNDILQMQQSMLVSLETNLNSIASKMHRTFLVVDRVEKMSAQIYECVKDGHDQDNGRKELIEFAQSSDLWCLRKPFKQSNTDPSSHTVPNGLNGGQFKFQGLESITDAPQNCAKGILKTPLTEQEERLALETKTSPTTDTMTPQSKTTPRKNSSQRRPLKRRPHEQNAGSQKGDIAQTRTFKAWACTVCMNVNYSGNRACTECGSASPNSDKELQDAKDEHQIKLMEDSSFTSIFANVADPERPVYHVEDGFKTTGFAQALARSSHFHNVTVVVVFLNALWIGVESELDSQPILYNSPAPIVAIDMFFCIFFVFEWLIRTLAFKQCRDALRDGWYRFDTVLVISMVLDYWILNVVLKIIEDESDHSKSRVVIPTAPLRCLRLLKVTRMARLMRAFPELVTMVKGLIRSIRATASTIMMLVLMDYFYAVILHQLLKDNEIINALTYEDTKLDFTSLWKAMWLLCMNGTFMLDGTAPMLTNLLFSNDFIAVLGWFIICGHICCAAILILNMLIGVLTELVDQVGKEQRNAAAIHIVRQELLAMLKEYDEGNGHISHAALMGIMSDSKAIAVFKHLGINELFMLQQIEMLYRISDRVSIGAALNLMLTCRSQNLTTIETLAGGFSYMATQVDALRAAMVQMEGRTQSEITVRIEDLKRNVIGNHCGETAANYT